MQLTSPTKTCRRCDRTLSIRRFGTDKQRPDGLTIYCRDCRHDIYIERGGAQEMYRHFEVRTCERCGRDYKPTSPIQKFCSVKCRANAPGKCEVCGDAFRWWEGSTQRFCSVDCRHASTVGRRYKIHGGYIRVRVPDGTPGADNAGRMLEHRYVMQQRLGRPIEKHETVHHINGIKDDNRDENLQLHSGRHGKGVAHVCLDCGSRNIGEVDL